MEKNSKGFVCINCGKSVVELFKEYSPSVLKMSNCEHCHKISDKYIEYDPVIVIIDLMLLDRHAYRHVIYNTTFKNHWKLAIILLIVEAYYNWSKLNEISLSKNVRGIHSAFFQGENNFYVIFGKSAFEMALVFCTIYTVTYLIWAMDSFNKPRRFSLDVLWKSVVLSNFGTFLLILHMTWGTPESVDPMIFVITYIFFSQIQALSVAFHSSRALAFIVALAALAMKVFSKSLLSSIV
ncbi:protein ARV1 [Hetaerina americana]|uniref:protein ARV1 n=1 Tax=Hetaerina americana TaxID=62018 RepID=UPI003A7F228E